MSALLGDSRANENLHLTSMHLIWARQHNLLAKSLSDLNPHWTDERVFQETRRIIAAQMQHITYNEFLPILLGNCLVYSWAFLIGRIFTNRKTVDEETWIASQI